MDVQQKVPVAVFTDVNRDVFLSRIYPKVREARFLQRTTLCYMAADDVNSTIYNDEWI